MAQRPSILQLEQAFLSAWPAVETVQDGGWLWRFALGYTKRANSAQSMDPGDEDNVSDRLARFVKKAETLGLMPTFRVTPLAGPKIVAALNGLGWQPFEQSVVLAMPVGASVHSKHAGATFEITDPAWYQSQAEMSGYDPDTIIALADLLARITAPARGLQVLDEAGAPAAAALASVNEGIGIYLNVVVRPDARGQGFGRSVMLAALEWSRGAGAKWAAIQVQASNVPAVNLYRSLGFEEIYRYHYRRPAQLPT